MTASQAPPTAAISEYRKIVAQLDILARGTMEHPCTSADVLHYIDGLNTLIDELVAALAGEEV